MITMIVCAKRKAGMSLAEFNRYWTEQHAPLVKSVPEFMRHVRKYVQYQFESEESQAGSLFGGLGDYDGVGELWFDSREAMKEAYEEPRYLEIIRPDEINFLNVEKCLLFVTKELIMHDQLSQSAHPATNA